MTPMVYNDFPSLNFSLRFCVSKLEQNFHQNLCLSWMGWIDDCLTRNHCIVTEKVVFLISSYHYMLSKALFLLMLIRRSEIRIGKPCTKAHEEKITNKAMKQELIKIMLIEDRPPTAAQLSRCYFVFHYFPAHRKKSFSLSFFSGGCEENDKIFLIKLKFSSPFPPFCFRFGFPQTSATVSSINIKIFWRGNSNGKLKSETLSELRMW